MLEIARRLPRRVGIVSLVRICEGHRKRSPFGHLQGEGH